MTELCDTCGSPAPRVIARANALRLDLHFCDACGAIRGSPLPAPEALDSFYDDEFTGDGGAQAVAQAGIAEAYVAKEERIVRDWSGPLMKQALRLGGARVLDIRGRTGALSAFMAAEGAEVTHSDPFPANLAYARESRGLASRQLRLTETERLAAWTAERFDAVSALSVHLLAHVLSPARTLDAIAQVLKPGGLLVFDEKDISEPVRYKNGSIYNSGRAHLHHYTVETLRAALVSRGYTPVLCAIDPSHATAFRHIAVIARAPRAERARLDVRDPARARATLRRIVSAERGKFVWTIRRKLGLRA